MSNPVSLNLSTLKESTTTEYKLALGRDGKGALPRDFFPTYSAFANTHGGTVILGIKEKSRKFTVEGVSKPDKIITDLFNTLNNPQKVSINLLTEDNVRTETVEGKQVIIITIPQATRKQKPVYLNGNPMGGNTYIRLHEGDRPCDDERVKRMMGEQVYDVCDQTICTGFTLDDLDADSIKVYRNHLKAEKLGHPWVDLEDMKFLTQLGCYRKDRKENEEGVTLAGLLMFGTSTAITEYLPHYFLDYQEKPDDPKSDTRWLDRIIPDGTWSGNLFDFYLKIVRKLSEDLKVPFKLVNNVRQDDTPTHQAIREALVNCLVHADYRDRMSVLVTKHPNGFSFRNPGLLRVPAEVALEGGVSDCRNQTLQKMFLLIGLGERAGSGLPKIIHGWRDEGHGLELHDDLMPMNHTVLEMTWKTDDRVNVRESDLVNDGANPDDAINGGLNDGKNGGENENNRTSDLVNVRVNDLVNVRVKLDDLDREILKIIEKDPHITQEELAEKTGKSDRTIRRRLDKMKGEIIERKGSDKTGTWELIPPSEQNGKQEN
jgi:predicted HTH transcriptional regulator